MQPATPPHPTGMSAEQGRHWSRVRLGPIWLDALTFPQALDEIDALVGARQGGFIFTPNVDHFVLAESVPTFKDAYSKAHLVLVDGTPVLWACRLLGHAVPEKVSGSDLILPLLQRAGQRKWRVYLLGAGPGVAEEVARMAQARFGVEVVGVDSPKVSVDRPPPPDAPEIVRIRQARPDLLMVALGSPKQEIWIGQVHELIRPTVAIGVGAGFDFVSGRVKRAPKWVSKAGLEWLYRLVREPKRLWRRYLVQDPKFAGILLRAGRTPRSERVQPRLCALPLPSSQEQL